MKAIKLLVLSLAITSTALADKTDEKKTEEKVEAKAEKKPETFTVAKKTFTIPADWKKEKPSSSMRKAQLKVGKTEIAVFHFGGGQGGDSKANIERWLKQFQDLTDHKTTEEKIGDPKTKIITATAKGTYLSGPPFGEKTPNKNYALRGVIIELEESPVFIKMTGPEKEVEAAAKAFDKMVHSAFKK